ncbi:response regulator receiver domain-containing protein [Pseudoduganella flava]|uniref:Response regulator n=1 Tax=Pseudoduganella flava TaxID=871742 RepID=A0A562P976_9BURK|nr:response regulator [Pseudoduganella flava]QGZ38041.1 response regulator [Pseudoduganella flava]TWI40978.1 response regulator receiver domain-containing protein [Pseudoduganella flava]
MSFTDQEVCIVDDDASVRTAVGSLVRSLGYGARLFASAEEFLDGRCAADLVICDVQMPGIGGLELLELLRARHDPVPFIVITAFLQDVVARRATAAGASCVLGKPFQANVLIRCIERALAAPPDHTHV